MPKAKKKAVETAEAAPLTESIDEHKDEAVSAAVNDNSQTPDLRLIDLDSLYKSNTNPRKRFPEASIEELATSIREKGILEPLIVRVKTDLSHGNPAFEIVCGERRYRAAMRAGLTVAPCLVRELTDDEVLDIQIHENLHREDVHPMDEAYGYKFLRDKIGCDVSELAVRVGKSEAYVLNRLKLNDLVPEVQKDIEDGYLPIAHALEIAKFAPDSQLVILNEGAYKIQQTLEKGQWVNLPIKDTPKLLNEFRDWIAEKILWRLAKAPFDRKATNLRADGLACVQCPNRTGVNASLFDEDLAKKNNDSCLDPVCWKTKAEKHVQITRERLAHEACVDVKEIPIVDTDHWRDHGEILGYENFTQIDPKSKGYTHASTKVCEAAITAVDVSDTKYGKTVQICLPNSGCKVHYSGKAVSSSSLTKNDPATNEAELTRKRERKEEIFDMRVAELVRWRVFRLAADKFASRVRIDGGGKDLLPRLVAKLWVNSNNGEASHTRGLVNSSMSEITDVPQGHFSLSHYDLEKVAKQAERLSDNNLKLTLFLLVHGDKGHTYFDSMTSQKTVRALADEYDLNFDLMDAQARVEIAGEKAKKYIDLYKAYLADVEAGKRSKIPRPWAPSYKPKDA